MIPGLGAWLISRSFFNNQPTLVQISVGWLLLLNNCWVFFLKKKLIKNYTSYQYHKKIGCHVGYKK
jgi:hypothetical protein